MKVIAVLQQKGGAGKTTIATHLATAIRLTGATVTLVDSDPQGSARDWAASREEQRLPVIGIDRPTIERDLKSLAPVDYVIIDGAPQLAELMVSAIKAADFVLIPVQPSPYDVWASAYLVDLVKARIEITDGRLAAAFIVSRAITGSNLSKDVTVPLEAYGLPVLAARVHQRVAYPESAATGRTVLETHPGSEGSEEILALARELLEVVSK